MIALWVCLFVATRQHASRRRKSEPPAEAMSDPSASHGARLRGRWPARGGPPCLPGAPPKAWQAALLAVQLARLADAVAQLRRAPGQLVQARTAGGVPLAAHRTAPVTQMEPVALVGATGSWSCVYAWVSRSAVPAAPFPGR